MSDRRRTPFNGKVAAAHLKGFVEADRYVEAEPKHVAVVVADLCAEPGGARDRQLLRGEAFMCLDVQEAWIFGYAEKDGYVGWIEAASLNGHPSDIPTHRVSSVRSYGKSTPGLKDMGRVTPLPFDARLAVVDEIDGWSRIAWGRGALPRDLYVPSKHLARLDFVADDPVAVAELFLGTPYLWGGNSAFGIDCSGLVQAACVACDIACPGDSDMQAGELGVYLADDAPLKRGDLLFWEGHVAWVVNPNKILHANAHHMAVVHEPLEAAIERIEAQGDGPVIARKRLEIPT
ncbi:MAG: NlpC/P60 family protein [Pseudomonadota bacterium]